MGHVDYGGGSAYVGAGAIWEISVPSSQLCCESKTALKQSLFKKVGNRQWWLHNLVSVNNATELYTQKWLKWQILLFISYNSKNSNNVICQNPLNCTL